MAGISSVSITAIGAFPAPRKPSSASSLDVVGDALEHRVGDTLSDASPHAMRRGPAAAASGRGCCTPWAYSGEPLRGVGPAAEDHVLDAAEQFGFDLAVHSAASAG